MKSEVLRENHAVRVIDKATAKAFTINHHYSATFPASVFQCGLFGPHDGRSDVLVGVCAFSVPAQPRVITRYLGVAANEGLELGRLVCLDAAPRNSESYLVSKSLRLLRGADRPGQPRVRGVVSFADATCYTRADGSVRKPPHIGTIYQATNAVYLGMSPRSRILLDQDGCTYSQRASTKITLAARTLARGKDHPDFARDMRRANGWWPRCQELAKRTGAALPDLDRDDLGQWYAQTIASAKNQGILRSVRTCGNHIYVWRLDPSVVLPPAQPYPKQGDRP